MAQQQWFVVRGDGEEGPFSGTALKEMAASGNLKPTDLVRRGDVETARPAAQIKGLFPAEASPAPPRTAKQPVETAPPAGRLGSRTKTLLLVGAGGLVLLLVGLGVIGALAKKGKTKDGQAAQPDTTSAATGQGTGEKPGPAPGQNSGAGDRPSGEFPADDPRYAVEVPDFSKVDYTYDFSKDDYDTLPTGARRTTRDREIKGGAKDLIGKVETQDGYIDAGGKFIAHGKFWTWYDKAAKRKLREGTILHGKSHGVVTFYHEDGSKSQEISFVDQKEHGVWRSWHENGKPKAVLHYLSGKQHGRSEGWYENGQKEWEYTWVEGQKHGPQKEWWDNGGRKRYDPHKSGARHGHYADWERDGQQGAYGLFEDGRPVGKHRLAYIEAGTGKRYYLDVDDQPWKGGTVAEFIAKMHYTAMRTRPQVKFQFDPRAGIATFVADSEKQFFELFGRPASDIQDPEKLSVPAPVRSQYRRWRYDLADGTLDLRVQPTQDRTLLITAKR